jgi:hypothetical protein
MGKYTTSRETFRSASAKVISDDGPATKKAEQQARKTGKLNPLVDPSGYGVIRRSLPRFEKRSDGLWELTVGTPMPIETTIDTTGSMGNNVDIALRVMGELFEPCNMVLPGNDIQIATGIFGDVQDNFVLCRPQFEMEAEKIVEQLTLMVPERDGGDSTEDPQYGIFGAAYLTSAYINRIGLKGYHFTVSDATARTRLDESQLVRIFGAEVFDKVKENGHQISKGNIPDLAEVVQDLLNTSHAFFLQVDPKDHVTSFWIEIFGSDRVVVLPRTEILPQTQALIIGLTEGTLDISSAKDFLRQNNVNEYEASTIVKSVANIPIGAQAALPNSKKRPQKGDLFREKTDLWPIDPKEIEVEGKKKPGKKPAGTNWL